MRVLPFALAPAVATAWITANATNTAFRYVGRYALTSTSVESWWPGFLVTFGFSNSANLFVNTGSLTNYYQVILDGVNYTTLYPGVTATVNGSWLVAANLSLGSHTVSIGHRNEGSTAWSRL